MSERSFIEEVDALDREFRRKLLLVTSSLIGGMALFALPPMLLFESTLSIPASVGVLALPCVISLVLAIRWHLEPSAKILAFGASLAVIAGLYLSGASTATMAVLFLVLLLMVTSSLITTGATLMLGGIDGVGVILFGVYGAVALGRDQALVEMLGQVGLLALFTIVVSALANNTFRLRTTLRGRVALIEEVVPGLADTGKEIARASMALNTLSSEGREGAFRQSSAVDETRGALATALAASRQITQSAQGVYENARRTSRHSEEVAVQVLSLAEQTQGILSLLEAIRSISKKSEILSLNAALESTRAGEAGRGFSLVAAQMSELSERVAASVRDIRALTDGIRGATAAVQGSVAETIELAQATTAAGQEISLSSQQQQASTEQVAVAMDDIVEISGAVTAISEQTLETAASLKVLAGNLPSLIDHLTAATASLRQRTDPGGPAGGREPSRKA